VLFILYYVVICEVSWLVCEFVVPFVEIDVFSSVHVMLCYVM